MASYKIKVENEALEFVCQEDCNIVTALSKVNGRHPMVGCRGGGCGICRVRVLEGDYTTKTMSKAQVSDEDLKAGITLACRTFPKSDMVLEYLGRK